jgi:hypothetical protein
MEAHFLTFSRLDDTTAQLILHQAGRTHLFLEWLGADGRSLNGQACQQAIERPSQHLLVSPLNLSH